MRVIDCLIYGGEEELILPRLSYLDQFCDFFIIVEAKQNFSGAIRDVDLRMKEYVEQSFPDKILWKVIEFPESLITPWEREAYQRNYLGIILQEYFLHDLILLSDLDEIPNGTFIETAKSRFPKRSIAQQTHYQYCQHSKNRSFWHGTIAFDYSSEALTPQQLRLKSVKFWENQQDVVINSGWHLSSFGSFKDKIQNFSHQELNRWPYTTSWFFWVMRNFGISVQGKQEIDWLLDPRMPFEVPCKKKHKLLGRKILTPVMQVLIDYCFRKIVRELSIPKQFEID
jgi:hypothetical protein